MENQYRFFETQNSEESVKSIWKKEALKNIENFTRRHLSQLKKIAGQPPATSLKKNSGTVTLSWISRHFPEHLFYRTSLGEEHTPETLPQLIT